MQGTYYTVPPKGTGTSSYLSSFPSRDAWSGIVLFVHVIYKPDGEEALYNEKGLVIHEYVASLLVNSILCVGMYLSVCVYVYNMHTWELSSQKRESDSLESDL